MRICPSISLIFLTHLELTMSKFLPSFVMILALLMIGFCILAMAVESLSFAFGVVGIACFVLIGYAASTMVDE